LRVYGYLWAMNHLGLFEGIGGFSLAARWMGWNTVAWCEIDPFCQTILKYHFPNAKGHSDIKTTDFSIHRGSIDILTGGFPCQPYSQAGKRLGSDDERHLWPEMLRAIREIQPQFVVGENVRGFINWNDGMVFEQACTDLENEGYEVIALILPAIGIDAPHVRDRVWIVAKSKKERFQGSGGFGEISQSERAICSNEGISKDCIPDTHKERQPNGFSKHVPNWAGKLVGQTDGYLWEQPWRDFPAQPPIFGRNDGIPARVANMSFSKWAESATGAAGNAIVPQLAHRIFKAIESTYL